MSVPATSRYAAWSTITKQKTKGVVKTQTRAARNDYRLVGEVVSVFKKSVQTNNNAAAASSGSASSNGSNGGAAKKPRFDIKVRLGSLNNNAGIVQEIVGAVEKPVRVFKIEDNKNVSEFTGGAYPKEKKLFSYDVVDCSINEDELLAAGGVEVGDLVELRGINFSNWFTKATGMINVYCNVDKIARIPGGERAAYGYDLAMEAHMPVKRIELELGTSNNTNSIFKAKLGRNNYTLNYFGSDAKSAEDYMSRPEYEIARLDFEPRVDPDNAQRHIVTYRPDDFNKEAGSGFIVANGFKTPAIATQHFADGSEQTVLAWIKLKKDHVALTGISDETSWTSIAPKFLEQAKYSIIMRENLEKTSNESLNHIEDDHDHGGDGDNDEGEGVDFKLAASVQTLLLNMPAEVERLGVLIPSERIQDLMGAQLVQQTKGADAMIASPLSKNNYHSRPGRNLAIALNEWDGNLSELIASKKYNFYLISNMQMDEEARDLLNGEPVDKHYLLFDVAFRASVNKEKGAAAKLMVAKKFGLGEDTEMIQLMSLASTVTSKLFYAVLKPEQRVSDYLDRSIFVEAVRMFVPDPEETLSRMRAKTLNMPVLTMPSAPIVTHAHADEPQGGTKRVASVDEPGDAETKHKTKRSKKDKDVPSEAQSNDEASNVEDKVASPKRGSKKGNKH
jgi:hypothetical protein